MIKRPDKIAIITSLIAMILASVALVVGRGSTDADKTEIQREVYKQLVGEVWREIRPLYQEMGLRTPDKPETIHELISPFVAVTPRDAEQ